MSIDIEQAKRESVRWYILLTLHAGAPDALPEELLLRTLDGADYPLTLRELRVQLDYLEDRRLVRVQGQGVNPWVAELTHHGTDIVEYAVECLPGIARPLADEEGADVRGAHRG